MRSIIENIMLDVMFECPPATDIKKCVITKEVVENQYHPHADTTEGQVIQSEKPKETA